MENRPGRAGSYPFLPATLPYPLHSLCFFFSWPGILIFFEQRFWCTANIHAYSFNHKTGKNSVVAGTNCLRRSFRKTKFSQLSPFYLLFSSSIVANYFNTWQNEIQSVTNNFLFIVDKNNTRITPCTHLEYLWEALHPGSGCPVRWIWRLTPGLGVEGGFVDSIFRLTTLSSFKCPLECRQNRASL